MRIEPALQASSNIRFASARNDVQISIVPSNTNSAGPVSVTLRKPSVDSLKTDLKFVTAAREYSDGAAGIFGRGEDERARDYSRAARERFVFHAAFIRADGDFIGSTFLDEVHVCAVRRKHFVMTNRCTLASHIDIIDVRQPESPHAARRC